MFSRIETLEPKKLVGKRLKMSLSDNRTPQLWQSFMKERMNITAVDSNLYSLQLLPADYYANFNPAREFEKWACAEVSGFAGVPEGMERLDLDGGLYAVFLHKGGPATAARSFEFIFGEWFPESGYVYDERPQFELLGEKYNNLSADSEEEIWIPLQKKHLG